MPISDDEWKLIRENVGAIPVLKARIEDIPTIKAKIEDLAVIRAKVEVITPIQAQVNEIHTFLLGNLTNSDKPGLKQRVEALEVRLGRFTVAVMTLLGGAGSALVLGIGSTIPALWQPIIHFFSSGGTK